MKTKRCYINKGKNIKEMLNLVIDAFPGEKAFMVKENGKIRSVSFFELLTEIRQLGTGLFRERVAGERVAIIGDNSYRWISAFLSIVCGGGVAVPLDKGFTAPELKNCLVRSKAKALFYDAKHEAVVKEAVATMQGEDGTKALKLYKLSGEGESLTGLKVLGEEALLAGSTEFYDVKIKPEDLAVILFTSGTTSMSKAVMLSHNNIMSNIRDMQCYERFYPWDVNMAFLPLHHSFGLVGVLVFMASGACSVFCDGLKYISKNLAEYGVTVFVGVPLLVENMYKKICHKIQKDNMTKKVDFGRKLTKLPGFSSLYMRRKIFDKIIQGLGGHLRLIICGAAPLLPETAAGLNGFGIVTIQGYGLTETSPVIAAERPEDLAAGSVGKPMPSIEVRIKDKDSEGIGEIVVKGPNVMMGYLDQPEETDKVIQDGWFSTGDLGRFDEGGHLWITGRKKNVIVMKNGKNVFPEEIESIIDKLPYVSESMIFTREKHNELVLWTKIVYKPEYLEHEGVAFDELVQQVRKDLAKVNESLPKYKEIHHFLLTDEPMIKTTTQKVKRNLEIEKINGQWQEELCYNNSI